MNKNIKAICVFASASNDIDKKYENCAKELGTLIGKNGYNVVYGGSNRSLMGAVTLASKLNGSEVIGVMPKLLKNIGIEEGNCTKFIITEGMRERKAKMDELSQAIIALPGGFGTLEELSEMIVQKQMGYNSKPIVILNVLGYYNKLIEFFDDVFKEKFSVQKCKELYFIANSPQEAIEYINSYVPQKTDYLSVKLNIEKEAITA